MQLTNIEKKIIKHLKTGLTFRQIAEKTGISATNVGIMVNELYDMFKVCDRIELIKKVNL